VSKLDIASTDNKHTHSQQSLLQTISLGLTHALQSPPGGKYNSYLSEKFCAGLKTDSIRKQTWAGRSSILNKV